MQPVTHGPRDRAAVALTFDDGPGAVTARLLDVLRDGGGRATFNLMGPRVAPGAALVRRAAAEGHELAVHGWEHRDLSRNPPRAWVDLMRTRRAIQAVGGVRARTFRPPFGASSSALVAGARAIGLTTVNWDIDPHDYDEPGALAIRERVRAAVQPGSIVLLHDDRPGLAPTADAVEGILEDLRDRGLATVTVSELLGIDGRR